MVRTDFDADKATGSGTKKRIYSGYHREYQPLVTHTQLMISVRC